MPLLAALGSFAALTASSAPAPILATRFDERWPAAAGSYLAWTQSSSADPQHFDVYARHGSGRPFKVNRAGTQARTGGIDHARLVYQEIVGGRSDLRLYDLAHLVQLPLRSVNTRLWEMRPTLSGRWLLFGRIDYATKRYAVVLHNLSTGRERELDVISRSHRPVIDPGQVNGHYAAWTTGADFVFNVFRYDTHTGRRERFPGPNQYRVPQYAASVTRAGTVYFVRSGLDCGEHVTIMQASLHRRARTIARLPAGVDLLSTYAARQRLLFDRGECDTGKFDLYELKTGA